MLEWQNCRELQEKSNKGKDTRKEIKTQLIFYYDNNNNKKKGLQTSFLSFFSQISSAMHAVTVSLTTSNSSSYALSSIA